MGEGSGRGGREGGGGGGGGGGGRYFKGMCFKSIQCETITSLDYAPQLWGNYSSPEPLLPTPLFIRHVYV